MAGLDPAGAGAIALAMFAAVGPFMLDAWIRSDYEWVIRQHFPCSAIGGGPGGAVAGGLLLAGLAASMFADRAIFAFALGCL